MLPVKINSLEINRVSVDDNKIPLANTYVSIEIKGISIAYINAFRRTSIDELPGYALQVPNDTDWNETTDHFMLPQFVIQRISLIPLKPNLGTDYNLLRFDLNVTNNTTEVFTVYSKDLVLKAGILTGPIFNPTFKICILQPGKSIVIKNIYIGMGVGKDNVAFQRVRCACYKHLDIEEYDRAETHLPTGSQVDNSGYKVSSMLSNPMHHLYKCIIPATNTNKKEIISIFMDICTNIKGRIQFILSHIESNNNTDQTITYNVMQLSDGIYEGILVIKNETYTIGELIRRTSYDIMNNYIDIKYTILSHDDCLTITIHHIEHVSILIRNVLKCIINIFEQLHQEFIRCSLLIPGSITPN